MLDARAPSTRACYATKWRAFRSWCQAGDLDPFQCPLPQVLAYLQSLYVGGSAASTVKVHAAAIAAYHVSWDGETVLSSRAGALFLKGVARARPPSRPLVPSWDLGVVLEMLSRPPYEPLAAAGISYLSFKTAFLLAMSTALRVSDMCGFSIQDGCLVLQEDLSQVVLRPNPAFVGKSGPLVRIEPVVLHSFPPPDVVGREELCLVCPVRALSLYLDRTSTFRGPTLQLLVCYGGPRKGQALSSEGLSTWLQRVISASLGPGERDGVRAHSTRGVAASVALLRGVSVPDICRAARWGSARTFARFYRMDMASDSFSRAVLCSAPSGSR